MNITLTISGLGSSGEGVGSLDGLKVFVDGALPGETVRAELTVRKKNYGKARLLEILAPSPHRIKPICPLFGRCGGCQLMHLSYEEQLRVKTQQVADAMQRIGKLPDVAIQPCIPSPTQLAYRNKIQLPVLYDASGVRLGLFSRRSHDIIPVDRCYIHCELGEAVYSELCKTLQNYSFGKALRYVLIKSAIHRNETMVVLVTNGRYSEQFQQLAEALLANSPAVVGVVENINTRRDNVILGSQFRTLAGSDRIYEDLCGLNFSISPAAFFQVNTLQAENLYRYAIEKAEIQETTHVVDAFCGVGGLALLAARKAGTVTGIECVAGAIKDAELNAAANAITNTTFICGQAERTLHKVPPIDCLLLNPPRKGCDPAVLEAAMQSDTRSIVYISCNPATLARDLSLLCQERFTVTELQPFDMFPQTTHVETIAVLRRRDR